MSGTGGIRVGLSGLGRWDWPGGREYVRNLALALSLLPEDERQITPVLLFSQPPGEHSLTPGVETVARSSFQPDGSALHRLRWRIGRLFGRPPYNLEEHFLASQKLDLVYPASIPRAREVPRLVGWVPDFQEKYLPQNFSPDELYWRDRSHREMATVRDGHVIFSSENAAEDFRRFYPGAVVQTHVLRFRPSLDPAWFGQDADEVRREFHLDGGFYLVSNQLWAHKNHLLVLEALSRLRERGLRPTVVFTGLLHDYRNEGHPGRVLQEIQKRGLAGQVIALGSLPKGKQIQLLRSCNAVIQPALFEGWSTIIEEARAMGKPVLASRIGVHEEQLPGSGWLFDAASPDSLADLLERAGATLRPGVDPEAEQAARERNLCELREVGRQFSRIVRAAMA